MGLSCKSGRGEIVSDRGETEKREKRGGEGKERGREGMGRGITAYIRLGVVTAFAVASFPKCL